MQEKSSIKGFFVTLGLIIVVVLFAVNFSVKQQEETREVVKGKDSVIAYYKGITDSLLKRGREDTVKTERVPYPVYVEVPVGTQYGQDSTHYTVKNEHGTVDVTTYPATDSARIEIEPIVIFKYIERVDTLLLSRVDSIYIHRVDTLKITVPEDRQFYDHWEFGAAGATVVGIITAILIGR